MRISDLLDPERIACEAGTASKKRVLERLSHLISLGECKLSEAEIFDSLISRERLGSTGFGHGVAIPHGRVANCRQTTGAFIKLQQGVDFDAIDSQPVDLLFAVLVPQESTEEHLQLLSMLAEMFSDKKLVEELRNAASAEAIYRLLTDWSAPH